MNKKFCSSLYCTEHHVPESMGNQLDFFFVQCMTWITSFLYAHGDIGRDGWPVANIIATWSHLVWVRYKDNLNAVVYKYMLQYCAFNFVVTVYGPFPVSIEVRSIKKWLRSWCGRTQKKLPFTDFTPILALGWIGTSVLTLLPNVSAQPDLPDALVAKWKQIPVVRFQSPMDSLPREVEAVIVAD